MTKFELGNVLAEALGNVSESDTIEQIELISINDIRRDERNFYSVDGIEALAANIELVGLLDPLRVRKTDAVYTVVSGHRRLEALWLLYKEAPAKWKMVPCIVETAETSPEMQELRLIYANADTRRMSSYDQAEQAKRVEELLYRLKEQGVEFPGRMRDHVAEACKLGQTKLAELKVIEKNLTNTEIRPLWEAGKLNHAQAYAIAKAKPYTQAALVTFVGIDEIPGCAEWTLESKIRKIETIAERKCKHTGGYCENCEVMLYRVFNTNSYSACEWHCCAECSELAKCKSVCKWHQAEAEKKKAAEKEKKTAERAEEKSREAAAIAVTKKIWTRFGELRREKGLSAKDCAQARGDSFWSDNYHGEEWHEQMEGPQAKITEHTTVPWTNSMQADDVEKLIKTADTFGVSCDYLLGRTDEERIEAPEMISVDDRYPKEGQYVMAFTRWLVPVPSVYFRAAFMDCTEKSVGNIRLKDIEFWSPMPRLPDGKKWPGQETIEGIVGGRK